jgi:hypothetical protein
MATVLTPHAYAGDARMAFGGNGKGRVTITSEWTALDLVISSYQKVFKAAKECVISNVIVSADDLDTHASPTITIDVGIFGGDDDVFVAASTAGQAGVTTVTNATADGALLAADAVMMVSLKAAAATAAAGTIKITFDVSYT